MATIRMKHFLESEARQIFQARRDLRTLTTHGFNISDRGIEMLVKVRWDFDLDDCDMSHADFLIQSGLSSIVNVPDDIDEDFVSDWLSDKYGYCHYGWSRVETVEGL